MRRRLGHWAGRLIGLGVAIGVAAIGPEVRGQGGERPGRVAGIDRQGTGKSRLDFAEALLRDRRYELAIEQFRGVLDSGTADGTETADATYGLARAELFLRRYLDARRDLTEFLRLAPDHPDAPDGRFRLGEAAYLDRDWQAAGPALESYLAGSPDNPHRKAAWAYLGDARLALGDLPGAVEAYRSGLADPPDGPLANRSRYYLSKALAALGQIDEAVESLDAILALDDPAWNGRAGLQKAQLLLGAGRGDEALALLESIERTDSKSANALEIRLRKAEALTALDRPDEAELVLTGLLHEDALPGPIAAQAAYDLGGLQLAGGKPELAIETLQSGLELASNSTLSPLLTYRSAEALAALGRETEARARFEKVAADFPDDAWADRGLLAAARLALEAQPPENRDPEAARRLSAQLLAQYPESPLLFNARLIEARALRLTGREAEAIPTLTSLVDDPDTPEGVLQAARYDLGLAYKATGQSDRAAVLLAESAGPDAGAVASYTLGQARFEAGQFDEAVGPLERFIKERPDDPLTPHALAYLAVAQEGLDRRAESDAALARLAEGWPAGEDLARIRVRLGESAYEAGNYERSAELLGAVAEGTNPALTAQARSGLGWSLVKLGRPDEAADAFADAIEAEPDGPYAAEAGYLKGWALQESGQVEPALMAYNEAVERSPSSPESLRARLARARLLAREGRHEEAAADYGAYLTSAPADLEGRDRVLAELAGSLRESGQTAEADATLDRLAAEFPESRAASEARFQLGKLAYQAGNLDEAAAQLGSVAADPEASGSAISTFLLGRIGFDRGDYDEARARFGQILDDPAPDGPLADQARFWRAESAFATEDYAAAEPDFAALADNAGPEAEAWRATAWLRQIQSQLALKRWDDAVRESEELLAKLPNFPQRAEVEFARGRALQSRPGPRFEEAREAYGSAIADAPGSELAARAQFMRGETYFFEKKYRDAEREYLAVALTYDAPKWQAAALLQAGKADEADGRPDDAEDLYRKLLNRFPDDPSAAEARARSESLKPR